MFPKNGIGVFLLLCFTLKFLYSEREIFRFLVFMLMYGAFFVNIPVDILPVLFIKFCICCSFEFTIKILRIQEIGIQRSCRNWLEFVWCNCTYLQSDMILNNILACRSL